MQFKKRKKTYGGALLLYICTNLKPATRLKVTLLHGCFCTFLKWYKWHKIAQNITYDKPTLRFELFFDWHYQQILDAFKKLTMHKKWSFSLRIYSVNVKKFFKKFLKPPYKTALLSNHEWTLATSVLKLLAILAKIW